MSYARDYFEQAREAVRELQNIRLKLEGLPYQMDVGGIDYSKPTISHGTAQSGMPAVEQAVDAESRYIERMGELVEVINAAYDIIYGRDRKSGLLALAGYECTDALELRYLKAMSWQEVSKSMNYSVRACHRFADTALDMCEAYGLAKVRDGKGVATI